MAISIRIVCLGHVVNLHGKRDGMLQSGMDGGLNEWHREHGVLAKERGKVIDVAAVERVNVPLEERGLRLRQGLIGRIGGVLAAERDSSALDGAVDRCHRSVQALGDFGGRPAKDFGQQQRSTLASRQILKRGNKCQPRALAKRGEPTRLCSGSSAVLL
jgi:hypothetical protein